MRILSRVGFFLFLVGTTKILTAGLILAQEKIDINTASLEELQKIIWVGPVIAQRIIENRPFYSLDDLLKIKGIGKRKLEDIKKQGLAWVDPKLKRPEIEKETESLEKGLAAISEPLYQTQGRQIPKSLSVFLIALSVAIFSGIIVLILKKKIKIDYNKNI